MCVIKTAAATSDEVSSVNYDNCMPPSTSKKGYILYKKAF